MNATSISRVAFNAVNYAGIFAAPSRFAAWTCASVALVTCGAPGGGGLFLCGPRKAFLLWRGRGTHLARFLSAGDGVAAGTWRRHTCSGHVDGPAVFYDDLGAVGLVGLRAPVSPQVPGLGVGAAGGCGGSGREGL
jgi:hypothetical protein